MLFAENVRVEDTRRRVERIDSGVDAALRDGARENRGRVEVSEGGRGSRIGQVIGGDVNRLHRGDRALAGRGDALLQLTEVGAESRLVADRAGHAAEQSGDLGVGLREAEDVVDEEKDVLAFFVAEMLGDRECREGHAGTRSRGLVHLAVHESGTVDNAGFLHLEPEVIALTGTLSDAAEHRVTAVLLGDVVDQLHDQDGLADAGTAEEADLSAARVRGEEVDDLDAGFERLDLGSLVDKFRRGLVDVLEGLGLDRAGVVDRLSQHVQDATQRAFADRDGDARSGILGGDASGQAFRLVHRDAAHRALTEMLGDFDDEVALFVSEAGVRDGEGVEDRRKSPLGELDVDDRTDDLSNATNVVRHFRFLIPNR